MARDDGRPTDRDRLAVAVSTAFSVTNLSREDAAAHLRDFADTIEDHDGDYQDLEETLIQVGDDDA